MKKVERHEVVVKQPAEAVWRAHIKNFQLTLPAISPHYYSSVEYLDGPPLAPGGVVHMNYNPTTFPHFDYLKFKWDAIDHEKYYCKCDIFEGGHMGGKCSDAVVMVYTLQLEPGLHPNSCVMVWNFHYDDSTADNNLMEFLKEEMSVFGDVIHSHLSSKA